MLAKSEHENVYHHIKETNIEHVFTSCGDKLLKSHTIIKLGITAGFGSYQFPKSISCNKCFPTFKTKLSESRAKTIKKFNLPHLKTKE